MTEAIKALYCFDFDGTLVSPVHDYQSDPVFFEWLKKTDASPEKVWVINTGRDFPYLLEGLEQAKFPVLPRFVICRERDIYELNEHGEYEPHQDWNEQCEYHINCTIREGAALIKRFKAFLKTNTKAEWLEFPGDPAGVKASSDEEMDEIIEWVDQQMHLVPALDYQRNSIWMRFGDHRYQKGSSLKHVASLLNVSPAQTLVAGDGDNDLSLFDSSVAHHIVAPANANYQVQQAVAKKEGYLAKARFALGTLEGVLATLDNE